ncbi:acyl-CoA dehydrogenase family protein [Algiphilus sp. W345]|uniref:Acyl-CoA dehydrogenase family protein n=1 Tax=Banduia mediterranea TaxID=3075609 RepID=A0ABU2WE72_9GAMM|nr:acyl-CoA dehydrogenase family protein [Algiphilus sp. W345]MDT0496173.1 acyl-CoA dehydrogenase family protein [Algiphilus sp. W345]
MNATTDWNALSDEDFRLLVRQFFREQYPEHLRYPKTRLRWAQIRDWYLMLSKKGWLAPAWPVEYGGMGLSPAKLMIFTEEGERRGVARAPDMGITMVGPLLIQHGSEAQKAYYLPKILSGEHIWCQGYSEPNAGSDLASLRTEAVLDGEHFVVNGQKTWTTLAQDATHIFLLVRTDKSAKKQEGISFLLADMSTPGIERRPIRNLAGHEEFCECFFHDVRVPRENIVGELNRGWTIAKALLGFERIFLGSPKQSQYAIARLEELIVHRGLTADAAFMDAYARLKLDLLDHMALYERFADQVRRGETLGPDVSMLKIIGTENYQRIAQLMLEAAGSAAGLVGDVELDGESFDWLTSYYNSRPATIYGGANEIQRNILATQLLGLKS